jgi:hypothetical protein
MSKHENDPKLAVWFTPSAIRQHFEGTYWEKEVNDQSDDQLARIGAEATWDERIWKAFDEALRSAGGFYEDDEICTLPECDEFTTSPSQLCEEHQDEG